MPIEIKELVIKATVNQTPAQAQNKGLSAQELERLKKSIVQDCLAKVMDQLSNKIDR